MPLHRSLWFWRHLYPDFEALFSRHWPCLSPHQHLSHILWIPSVLETLNHSSFHKSGSLSETSNFRPISIVPAFPKVVEKVVQRQLYTYMAENHLFSSSQHGFRSHHSTETALLTVSDHILSATDRQDITLLCLLDLSKCFDVIDHTKLLYKLHSYSIDPTWFSSYLTGHTQSVQLTGGETDTSPDPFLTLSAYSRDPLLGLSCSRSSPTTYPCSHRRRTWYSTLMILKFWSQAKRTPSLSSLLLWNRHYHLWTPGSTPTVWR